MTEQGYIKIFRTFKNNIFYKNSEAVHLWLHLLFSASYEDNIFYYNNTKIKLKRGQLITGRKKLALETGISESKIFRLLKLFENEHQIEQQKTNKYSIITIVSYNKYNNVEQQNEQQMNNKWTTNEQQMNTTKELKELKELKENNINRFSPKNVIDLYHSICINLPKIEKLTSDRIKHINARTKELKTIDKWQELFEKVASSDFLNGKNDRNWKANLDWLIKSDSNYVKVIEGKYESKKNKGGLF